VQQEELHLLKSRSFWLVVASIVITITTNAGYTLPIKDHELAALLPELVSAILMVWAYVERYFGKKKLRVRRVRS
jgi:hypothetical protein